MARIIPDMPEHNENRKSEEHPGELESLRELESVLGDEFVVYRQLELEKGKIDFTVVNGDGKVLIIEQKDRENIEETGDDLIVIYPDGRKSVANQILGYVEKFRSAFCERHPGWELEIDYLVYLRKKGTGETLPVSLEGKNCRCQMSRAFLRDYLKISWVRDGIVQIYARGRVQVLRATLRNCS